MANSTFGDTCNKILELSGQGSIAQGVFATRSQLNRFQVQTKAFVDLASRMLLMDMNDRFMQKKFSFHTASGVNDYGVDDSTLAENVLYHSFFLILSSGQVIPLYNWDYREFKSSYPVNTSLPTGTPRRWILLPNEGATTNRIMFYPAPDADYTVEYQAQVNVVPLVNYTDIIQWPTQYEHALWLQGRLFLEQALGEGKESDIAAYCQKAVDAVRARSTGPLEQRKAIRPGIFIFGKKKESTDEDEMKTNPAFVAIDYTDPEWVRLNTPPYPIR